MFIITHDFQKATPSQAAPTDNSCKVLIFSILPFAARFATSPCHSSPLSFRPRASPERRNPHFFCHSDRRAAGGSACIVPILSFLPLPARFATSPCHSSPLSFLPFVIPTEGFARAEESAFFLSLRFHFLKILSTISRCTHPFQPGIYVCTPAMRAWWGLGRWLELREQFTQRLPSRFFGDFLAETRKLPRREAPHRFPAEGCGFLDSLQSLETTF